MMPVKEIPVFPYEIKCGKTGMTVYRVQCASVFSSCTLYG